MCLTLNLPLQQFYSWARASPLSCLLTTHTSHKRPKHKGAENLSPVDPTTANAESSASAAVTHLKSHARPRSSKKSQPLNLQTESLRQIAVADHQPHASDCPDLNVMRKNSAHFVSEEKMEEGTLRKAPLQPLFSKYSLLENRRTKPKKQDHNLNRVFVPIKKITLLPSIIPLQLNPKICYSKCSGQKAPYVETFEGNFSLFDKRSGKKGTTVDTVSNSKLTKAAPTSKYQICQYNHHLFSALSDTFPKRYQTPFSSKLDTVHPIRHPMGKNFSEAMAPYMHPSRLFS